MNKRALTFTELVMVIAVLGITAAIVTTQVKAGTVQLRESQATAALNALRDGIAAYTLEHDNGPGYLLATAATAEMVFTTQLTGTSNSCGNYHSNRTPTADYPYGPYLQEIPENPLNGCSRIKIVTAASPFSALADDRTGWIYQPETGEIRLNSTEIDKTGKQYYYNY